MCTPGGRPLMYPGIARLVKELVARRKYVYLCTNAILLKEKLEAGLFTPPKYFSFSVPPDGLHEEDDEAGWRGRGFVPGGGGVQGRRPPGLPRPPHPTPFAPG